MKKPCLHWPWQRTQSQLGRDPPRTNLRNGTKRASRICILQREMGSGKKPQPQCVLAQDRGTCLVLIWPYGEHRAQEDLGCLWLRGHCCLADALRSLKPTPNVFSFAEKADLA